MRTSITLCVIKSSRLRFYFEVCIKRKAGRVSSPWTGQKVNVAQESTKPERKATIQFLPDNLQKVRQLAVELRAALKDLPAEERQGLSAFGFNKVARERLIQNLYSFVRCCNHASEFLAKMPLGKGPSNKPLSHTEQTQLFKKEFVEGPPQTELGKEFHSMVNKTVKRQVKTISRKGTTTVEDNL